MLMLTSGLVANRHQVEHYVKSGSTAVHLTFQKLLTELIITLYWIHWWAGYCQEMLLTVCLIGLTSALPV